MMQDRRITRSQRIKPLVHRMLKQDLKEVNLFLRQTIKALDPVKSMRLKLLSLAVCNINQLKQEVLLWLTMGVAGTVIEVGSDSKRIPKMRSSDSHLRIIRVPQMDRDNPKLEVPSAFLVIIQISPHPNNTTPLTTNNRLS